MIPQNTKLAVDDYEVKGDSIICQCFTIGLNSEQEPDYLEKIVSKEEFKNHIADKSGFVPCYYGDTEYPVEFNQWFDWASFQDICWVCAEIINKREGRKVSLVPLTKSSNVFESIFNSIQNIVNEKPGLA
ncbi:MAG: hypothetical protein R3206_11865 [Salegentibacter mishustinae]|nr:hypothetical protein [Salegentibacter mishustinae]